MVLPLILAPGMLSDAAVWASQIQVFGPDRAVAVAAYGDASLFEDMARTLLENAPARFALAGHSMGARVALEACRLAPDRIAGLCLISADFRPRLPGAAGEQETRGRHSLLDMAQENGTAAVAQSWTPGLVHPSRQDDEILMAPLRAMVARQDATTLARQIAGGEARPDHAPVLRALGIPTLFVCGAQDGLGRAPLQTDMQLLCAGSDLVLIETCGHMPTLEDPAPVNEAMRLWLGKVDRAEMA